VFPTEKGKNQDKTPHYREGEVKKGLMRDVGEFCEEDVVGWRGT